MKYILVHNYCDNIEEYDYVYYYNSIKDILNTWSDDYLNFKNICELLSYYNNLKFNHLRIFKIDKEF